jgi:hypothetical protein
MAKRKLKDWMQAYGEYTSQSDSPQEFHIWGGLVALAGAAQRKILMRAAYYDVHSNMYVLLVSPPGRARKGAALRVSKNILKEAQPPVNFASESGSHEAMVDLFQKIANPAHQSLTIFSMEFGTLMATNPAGMVDFLTDIYDGNPDWSRNTKKNNLQTIQHPWLGLFSGTTPKWLGEHLGLIAVEGGFTARAILVYSEERLLENTWPEETDPMKSLRKDLIHDLSIIAALDGEFGFEGGRSGEAFRWYDFWYRDKIALLNEHFPKDRDWKSRFPPIADPRTASYYDRKHIHLLKVGMALSLSYKDEMVLTLDDLNKALYMLNGIEPGMSLAMDAVGKSQTANELNYIWSQIKASGSAGIEAKELLIANYHAVKDLTVFEQIISALIRMGRVKQNGTKLVSA